MAQEAMQLIPKLARGFRRWTNFELGLFGQLPHAYKKFWREWNQPAPAPLKTYSGGEDQYMQIIPVPLIVPPESHRGKCGGESVVKGFQKRHPQKRQIPHFRVPKLKRSVMYSKVLNECRSLTITEHIKRVIHDSRGFDHYLLKNLACDLRSLLALKLKRRILLELLNGCPNWAHDPNEQQCVLKEYKQYADAYTPEEIDWYGYTMLEAITKLQAQLQAENPAVADKIEFRKLIDKLKNDGIREAGSSNSNDEDNADLSHKIDLEEPEEPRKQRSIVKVRLFGRKYES